MLTNKMRLHKAAIPRPGQASSSGTLFLIFAVLLFMLVNSGCAKKKNDISQVSTTAYVAKSDLVSKSFSFVKAIQSANEELDPIGVVPGYHMDLGIVKFVVTESELQVRSISDVNRPELREVVLASFPITAHFDILRDKNDFGEDTNKIIEDTKKPWAERAFMRVDWSTNKISTTKLSNAFGSEIEEQDAKIVSPLVKDGDLLSFDTDETITQTEDLGLGNGDPFFQIKGALRAQVKTTFREYRSTDFKPMELSNRDFSRFGYFRTYENFANPERGATISGAKLLANKFNVCEANSKTSSLSCASNKITYVLNKGFPEEFRPAARAVIASWNQTFQKALDRSDDIVLLDEKIQPPIGDTRYNMITSIDEVAPTGLLGVSQTVQNPGTGETLSARASVYSGTVRYEAAIAGEQFEMIFSKAGTVTGGPTSLALNDLKSFDPLAKQIQGGGVGLLTDLDRMRTNLGIKQLKSDSFLRQINFSTIKVAASSSIAPLSVATSRLEHSLNVAPSYFSISDLAYTREPETKESNLRDTISFGKSGALHRMKELSRASKGLESADFVEPAVELFVRKFAMQHKGESSAQVKEELKSKVRSLVFYTTLIHEMGHNFGLRHNFASSSDKKNYSDNYYQLESKKQKLAAKNPNDPAIDALSLEQQSYDFSSVMDYAGGFNEALGGTGPYDLAAIRFAYNTSIDSTSDAITGISHNYKFCTDDIVGEDLLCQRFDKGANVAATTGHLIDTYERDYALRNLRRDRLNFSAHSYFRNILLNTMIPLRQVSDEFLYQLIQSPQVAAQAGECGEKFLKDSVDAGEVANLCDSRAMKPYADRGVDLSDWGQLVNLLLTDDGSSFRVNPSFYRPNGFADLLYSNYLVSQFFTKVIGTPEPGTYIPTKTDTGGMSLALLPASSGDEDAQILSYLSSKGVSSDAAKAQVPEVKKTLVDLHPGLDGKNLNSIFVDDGIFKQEQVLGVIFDKQAAIIAMGARGLPVEKYQLINLNTNMFLAPQTKNIVNGIFKSLITADANISSLDVVTRGGSQITATVPASLDLTTQYYGLAVGLSDFVSDSDHGFEGQLKICLSGDQTCTNQFKLPEASFRGATNTSIVYRAIQTLKGDSIAYEIVKKGDQISKDRDQAGADILDHAHLVDQLGKALSGEKLESSPQAHRSAFLANAKTAHTEFNSLVADLFATSAVNQSASLFDRIVNAAKAGENGDANEALSNQKELASKVAEFSTKLVSALAKEPTLLKVLQDESALVIADLELLSSLDVRVVSSQQMFSELTTKLSAVQGNAEFVRSLMGQISE